MEHPHNNTSGNIDDDGEMIHEVIARSLREESKNDALPATSIEDGIDDVSTQDFLIAVADGVLDGDAEESIAARGEEGRSDEILCIDNGIHESPKCEIKKQSWAFPTVHVHGIPGRAMSSVDDGLCCGDKQEGNGSSLEDTLKSLVGNPQLEDATIFASQLKTDASSKGVPIQTEMAPPKESESTRWDAAQRRWVTDSKPPTSPETVSLLSRGISLFSRGTKQVRPARIENDCNSVISEMTQDLKSVCKSETNIAGCRGGARC